MIKLSTAVEITDEQLEDVMNYHSWDEKKIANGIKVRQAIGYALKIIVSVVPPSADRDSAIRKLREARMDCNSAITFDGEL